MPRIHLASNERVLIAGKTGSGKTYLARYITRPIKRLVVLDGKATLNNWGLEPWDAGTVRALLRGEPIRARVVPPIGIDQSEYWNEAIMQAYHAGNCLIYIDELYAVAPPNQKPPDALWAAYTRGRELGLGVWAATQRPVWIPLFAMSEADHFFMFRLQLSEDRQRMAAFMGNEVTRTITDKHGFFYASSEADEPSYTQRLEVSDSGAGKLLEVVSKKQTIPVSKPTGRRYSTNA